MLFFSFHFIIMEIGKKERERKSLIWFKVLLIITKKSRRSERELLINYVALLRFKTQEKKTNINVLNYCKNLCKTSKDFLWQISIKFVYNRRSIHYQPLPPPNYITTWCPNKQLLFGLLILLQYILWGIAVDTRSLFVKKTKSKSNKNIFLLLFDFH